MHITSTAIPDVLLFKPEVHRDERGFFFEAFRKEHFLKKGIDVDFVQDNMSKSKKGTVRGLHYQIEQPQDKLIMVLDGKINDVAVDLRQNSDTFGNCVTAELSSQNKHQLFIPKGFAHGFSIISEEALVYYKCSNYYCPEGERGVIWNDPDLGIDWKIKNPIVSEKDQLNAAFNEIPKKDLF